MVADDWISLGHADFQKWRTIAAITGGDPERLIGVYKEVMVFSMTDPITEALEIRLAELRGKLAARNGQPGFGSNTAELTSAIEALEGEVERRKAAQPKDGEESVSLEN